MITQLPSSRVRVSCVVCSLIAAAALSGCAGQGATSYPSDVAFMRKSQEVIELQQGQARVAVVPAFLGRVMTSSFTPGGASLGWVNRPDIEKGDRDVPCNAFGGQDRFWMGPEGGQFSLFFKKGDAQNGDNWRVPDQMNKGAFKVIKSDAASVRMCGAMKVTNASGTDIQVKIDRTIRLVDLCDASLMLNTEFPAGVDYVGFVSENRITNSGSTPLTPESGTVSIWSMGQFPAGPHTVVIAPFNKKGSGPEVEKSYFGAPPANRLIVDQEHGVVLFRADSKLKSKFGMSPARSTDRLASIDFDNRVLTIIHFDLPSGETRYVNSLWVLPQQKPFAGDVIMSYNHHGEKNEFFYELESSSPAAFLAPGQSQAHFHRTLQFQGSLASLSKISEKVLGVSLESVRRQMP